MASQSSGTQTSRRNGTGSLGLPTELLVDIFSFCAVGRPAPPATVPWWYYLEGISNIQWPRLRLVCRHWRDVANGCSALWGVVHVQKSVEWVDLCLLRSTSLPVDIVFHYRRKLPPCKIEPPPLPSHRIRTLVFDADWETWRPAVATLFSAELPTLETLFYSGSHEALFFSGSHDDLCLRHERQPRLRVLYLAATTAPSDPLIYARLQSLDLNFCSCDCTYKDFIALLSEAKDLQQLRLCHFLDYWIIEGLSYPTFTHRVSLPRLNSIALVGHTSNTSVTFLNNLALPAIAKVDILRDNYAEADLTGTLPRLLPEDPPKLSAARLNTGAEYALNICAPPPPLDRPPEPQARDVSVTLSVACRNIKKLERRTQSGLQDLVALCRGPSLTSLTVSDGDYNTVAQQDWKDVFLALPALEVLEIAGSGRTTALWLGLYAASHPVGNIEGAIDNARSRVAGIAVCAHERGGIACPALRMITVGTLDESAPMAADTMLFETMAMCLRDRADRGARLQELHLSLFLVREPDGIAGDDSEDDGDGDGIEDPQHGWQGELGSEAQPSNGYDGAHNEQGADVQDGEDSECGGRKGDDNDDDDDCSDAACDRRRAAALHMEERYLPILQSLVAKVTVYLLPY
ncbi:hypothetical protein C8Q80DRAFT_1125221 [Daedaleopsis nitida]|nr:hypothetical protein C8Q80DRAFT_1125221 [Daedaleopsis nitida]